MFLVKRSFFHPTQQSAEPLNLFDMPTFIFLFHAERILQGICFEVREGELFNPFFFFFLVELFLLWTVKSGFMCSSVCHSVFLFRSTPPACGPSTWPTADPIPTTLLRSRPHWTPPSAHPVHQSFLHLPLLFLWHVTWLKMGKKTKTNVLSLAGWSKTSRRSSTHLIRTSGHAFSLNTHNPRLQDSSQVLGIHVKTRAWTDFYTPHVLCFFLKLLYTRTHPRHVHRTRHCSVEDSGCAHRLTLKTTGRCFTL